MTTTRTFTLSEAPAGLDFQLELPTDWIHVPLPAEDHDFSDAMHFQPIAVLMAPWAAVVFAVAARPGYADGTLAQWAQYLLRKRELDAGSLERQPLGSLPAVGCWGVQIENGTPMRARLLFGEDGGRLVQISCMAPEPLWATVAPMFEAMLRTFTLLQPRGSTVALAPPDEPLGDNTMQAAAPFAIATSPVATSPVETTAASVALADSMASLDPEQELNARLRARGAGLVPNVLHYDEQERWATVAPGSLRGTMRVPFGWHVIDDGKRALVFDATGHTQISMQLCRRDGRTDHAMLAAKVPELQQEWPVMRYLRTEVNGMQCLLVRDAAIEGKPIEQAYLLRATPDDLVLQTRVTSTPEHFEQAGNLAEILLRDLQLFGEQVT